MHRYLTLIFLFISFYSVGQTKDEKIRVGYAGSVPFVIHGDKEEGIVFDIWKEIAFDLNLKYTLQEFPSVEAGIEAAKNNEIEILLGPTTINEERAEEIAFSQPYYNTEMAILAPVQELSPFGKKPALFFQKHFSLQSLDYS